MSATPLKIRGVDAEDLEVIGSLLQDAIAPFCDMAYQEAENLFLMVVHRFCWCEAQPAAAPAYERICCAVKVTGVSGVQIQGLDQKDKEQILELLTVSAGPQGLVFTFAGGILVRLVAEKWEIRLSDFGEPWPTSHLPLHSQ